MATTGCTSSIKCSRLLKLAIESLYGMPKLGVQSENDNSAKASIGDNESMKPGEKSMVIPLSTMVQHHLQSHYLKLIYQSNNQKVSPNATTISNAMKIQMADNVLPTSDIYFHNLVANMTHNQGKCFIFDKCTYEREKWQGKAERKGESSWPSNMTLEALTMYKDELSLSSYSTLIRNMKLPQSPYCSSTQEVNKIGQIISKGHKNYDLMMNLQLGISYSITKLNSLELREITTLDFDPKEKFWTRFPRKGSKSTPPHQSVEFWWKDYCPMVFRHLMKLFSMDPIDYMMAICGNNTLKELFSLGKSGSLFYLTQNSRFMIKTIKKSEAKVLVKMLPNYYQHVCHHKNTLVTRFYGVHCLKPIGGQKVRFVVMENLLWSKYHIHRRFDLKGSSYGRTTNKTNSDINDTTTLKDLDLNFLFHLRRPWYKGLLNQIKLDCEFLEAEGIMDYSLLVGLHFQNNVSMSKRGLSSSCASSKLHNKREFSQLGEISCDFLDTTFACEYHDRSLDGWKTLMRLGSNMPARAEHVTRSKADLTFPNGQGSTPRTCKLHDVILYFGIIDVFQDYNISKKLEHAYKSLQVGTSSISAVDPKLYSKRFQDFISKIFVEDD